MTDKQRVVWVVENFIEGSWGVSRVGYSRTDALEIAKRLRAVGQKVRVVKYVPE